MAIATNMDTGQFPTYLFLFLIPILLFYLFSAITNLLPVNHRTLVKLLIWAPPPPSLPGKVTIASSPSRMRPSEPAVAFM
jgi:hypothetical protein